jgi:hypothetical protein
VGELCKAGGLKLAYHNHDFEFTKFGSTNGYEILLNETDKTLVDFEMDLYWVVLPDMIRCSYSKSIQDVSKCGMSKIWIK